MEEASEIVTKGLCRPVGGGIIKVGWPGVSHVVEVVGQCIGGGRLGRVSDIGDGFCLCSEELR